VFFFFFFGVSVKVRFGPECVRAFGNNQQVCAVVSLLMGKCVLPTTAMTGEVSKLHLRSVARIKFISDGGVLVCLLHFSDHALGACRPSVGSRKWCWAHIVGAAKVIPDGGSVCVHSLPPPPPGSPALITLFSSHSRSRKDSFVLSPI